MSTDNLKKELEAALLITDWLPTESDLQEIARRIKSLRGSASKTDIEKIVGHLWGSDQAKLLKYRN